MSKGQRNLRPIAALIVLLGTGCAGAPAPEAPHMATATVQTGGDARSDLEAKLGALRTAHSIEIATRSTPLGAGARTQGPERGGNYDWQWLTAADDPVLVPHLEALLRLWPRFPPPFVKTAGLKGILFVKHLRWNGLEVYGFEVADGVVFVNLTLGGQAGYPGDELFAYALFHEFFHLIQNRLSRRADFIDYERWRGLNAPGAAYHPKGTMGLLDDTLKGGERGWQALHAPHPAPGFVSRYAMADVWHDATETFCALFVTSRYRKTMTWAERDPYLRAKIAYLQSALRNVYSGFTRDYFASLHQ